MPAYGGPRNPNPANGEAGIVIYGYVPSLCVAIAGVALLIFLLLTHLGLLFRYRGTRTFQALLAFDCAQEVVGYADRLASHYCPFLVIDFVLQYFSAPIFFSAAIYLALAAILRHTQAPRVYSPLSPRTLVTVFVVADVLTIGTQVSGAALIGIAESALAGRRASPVTPEQANDILLAGLAVQSTAFLLFLAIFFCILTCLWTSTLPRDETNLSQTLALPKRPSMRLLAVLVGSALFVFLRTLFRLAETAQGIFGQLSTHEAYFTGLEFVPVVLALGLWAAVPLGRKLPSIGECT